MLTREQCVVGARVRGIWEADYTETCTNIWEGIIKIVAEHGWTADLYRTSPGKPDPLDNYAKNYFLQFDSSTMDHFILIKKNGREYVPNRIKSWSLACKRR